MRTRHPHGCPVSWCHTRAKQIDRGQFFRPIRSPRDFIRREGAGCPAFSTTGGAALFYQHDRHVRRARARLRDRAHEHRSLTAPRPWVPMTICSIPCSFAYCTMIVSRVADGDVVVILDARASSGLDAAFAAPSGLLRGGISSTLSVPDAPSACAVRQRRLDIDADGCLHRPCIAAGRSGVRSRAAMFRAVHGHQHFHVSTPYRLASVTLSVPRGRGRRLPSWPRGARGEPLARARRRASRPAAGATQCSQCIWR